jgi:hypothetical protein
MSAFGLYLGEELIAVTTGSRHHRTALSKDLVLDRMCFASGVKVHGGASRMIRALSVWAKNKGYERIVSWSDNRWSAGAVYEKTGFILDAELPPDYSYVKQQRRYSKQSLKKTSLERTSGKTERALRLAQGYDRIWDCGKKRWVLKLLPAPLDCA